MNSKHHCSVPFRTAIISLTLFCGLPVLAQSGAPDRLVVSTLMRESGITALDMNGDCFVSDIDVAMQVHANLVERYGPALNVGDVDLDGVVTGEDLVQATAIVLRKTFGKLTMAPAPVSMDDVQLAIEGVVLQQATADINLDGFKDEFDIFFVVENVGQELDFEYGPTDEAARQLLDVIGAIQQEGADSFMASGCAAGAHLPGVSNTWPCDHPSWWPDNHMSTITASYPTERPGQHSDTISAEQPGHAKATSRNWPANHLYDLSKVWASPPAPEGPHDGLLTNRQQMPVPPAHNNSLSKTQWPPNHSYQASATWVDHDLITSRGWWPDHTQLTSAESLYPPKHISYISIRWQHDTALSQSNWPPSHGYRVSQTWQSHQIGTSVNYPPNHVIVVSTEYPGPQVSWPANHVIAVSRSWQAPAPGTWPIFPSDHTWWTTAKDVRDFAPDRWPF